MNDDTSFAVPSDAIFFFLTLCELMMRFMFEAFLLISNSPIILIMCSPSKCETVRILLRVNANFIE